MAAKVYVLYVVGRIIVLSKHGLRLVLELSYKQICGECESIVRARGGREHAIVTCGSRVKLARVRCPVCRHVSRVELATNVHEVFSTRAFTLLKAPTSASQLRICY